MINFNNIYVKRGESEILNGISLEILKGEAVVLVGPSGSGKTSLLKTLVGALSVQSGSITVGDLMLSPDSVNEIRQKIAFVGQEPLMGADTVRESLLLPFTFAAHAGTQPDDDSLEELLEAVNLQKDILDKSSDHISGGQKQRIAIVRALLLDKSIFLADELTSALDRESKHKVMALLLDGERTILSVSHDPDWINSCSRSVEIVNGQIKGESK